MYTAIYSRHQASLKMMKLYPFIFYYLDLQGTNLTGFSEDLVDHSKVGKHGVIWQQQQIEFTFLEKQNKVCGIEKELIYSSRGYCVHPYRNRLIKIVMIKSIFLFRKERSGSSV